MLSQGKSWNLLRDITADQFLIMMSQLGRPEEITLVGVFDKFGRGSRQDVALPLHHDGDYSARKAAEKGLPFDKKIDIVGLYCIKGGETATQIESDGVVSEIVLKAGEALVFDNRKCRHGRTGSVGDRLLLRVWLERYSDAG